MKNLGVQYLRALGCIGIVVAHSFAYAEINYTGMVVGETLDYPGRYGMLQYVVFFFLITGYYITRQVEEGRISVLQYYKRRFMAIYPEYWGMAAICLALNLSYYHQFEATVGFYRSLFLIAGDNTTSCRDEWTLYITVLFYIVVGLFLVWNNRKLYKYIAIAAFLLVFLCNCINEPVMIGTQYKMLIKSVPMGSILCGGVLYYFEKWRGCKVSISHSVIPVLLMVLFTFSYDYLRDKSHWIMLALYYFLATTVFFVFKNLKVNRENRFLLMIGNNSYGIYLLHPTFFMILYSEAVRRGLAYGMVVHVVVLLMTMAASLTFSMLFRLLFCVEK